MKVSPNAIKIGQIIEHNGRLWSVVKKQHTQPGKGGAYQQIELKDIRTGTKLNERFRSGEMLEQVRLDERDCQYLFQSGDEFTFMDGETFEQTIVPASLLEEQAPFLQENMTVTISSHEGSLISVTLPETVIMEITQAEPVVKGQTASSSFKPAELENGLRIMVPPHIEAGTRVVVNTSDCTYVERAK
jgi:elongation factor P